MKTLSQILNPTPVVDLTEGTAWKIVTTTLRGLGFEEATHNDLRGFKGLPKEDIFNLYGIPMRAGKWADVWFAILEDDYAVINDDKVARFEKVGDAIKSIQHIAVQQKKNVNEETLKEGPHKNIVTFTYKENGIVKKGEREIEAANGTDAREKVEAILKKEGKKDIKILAGGASSIFALMRQRESIEEKLSADAPASEWIDDFVKSDDPRFEGKSKKERIKMALGAYYAAQNEDVEYDLEESDFPSQFPNDVKIIKGDKDTMKFGLYAYAYSSGRRMLYVNNSPSGDVYRLTLVPQSVHDNIQSAENAGEYYKNNVKGKFNVSRINEEVQLDEEVDYYKFKQLAILGLLSPGDANKAALGMKAIEGGHPPTQEQKRIIGDTLVLLVDMITGDSAVLNKLKKTARDAKTATA